MPFEIPEKWVWCKLEDIGDWGAGSTPSRSNPNFYKNGTIPWLTTGELNDSFVKSTREKITELALKKCSLRICYKGDILIAMYGATIGKLAIAGTEMTTNQACCACTLFYDYNKFLFYFLMANRSHFTKMGEGGAQPNISKQKITQTLMPLPPYNEQFRIVNEVERLFALIDKIEEDKASLEDAIKQAKRKVLELAVNGKLCDDNSHYEKYAQTTILGNLCKLVDGSKITDKEMPYLDVKYLRGKSEAQFFNEGQFVPKGTNMILVDGENSGEVFTAPVDGYKGSTFKLLKFDSSVYPEFILLFIQANQLKLKESKVGSAIPHLNKKLFKSLEIPLTNYEEQEEIVDKTKTIFSFLDKILINLV